MEDALRVVAKKESEQRDILDYIERLRDGLFIDTASGEALKTLMDLIDYKVDDGITPKP